MPDGTAQVDNAPAAPTLTEAQAKWTHEFTGTDPRGGQLPLLGTHPPATDVATVTYDGPSTDERRANLVRRVQASGAAYDKLGAAADNVVDDKDKLAGAEQKVGRVIKDDGQRQTTRGPDGSQQTVDYNLDGKGARTSVTEKGIMISRKQSLSAGWIGADGKAAEATLTTGQNTHFGFGNMSTTSAASLTTDENGKKVTTSNFTAKTMNVLTGDHTTFKTGSRETKIGQTNYKQEGKEITTKGLSGYSLTREQTTLNNEHLETHATNVSFVRGNGQLGGAASTTFRTGTVLSKGEDAEPGEQEPQYMNKGGEVTAKGSGGMVSDDKGTGFGGNAGASGKGMLGNGYSVNGNVGVGGKVQTIVKEISGKDPPKFQITTTISFDATVGAGGGNDTPPPSAAGKFDAKDPDPKVNIAGSPNKTSWGVSVSGSLAGSFSFKRELTEKEAEAYIECIRKNGHGSKLPEHQILMSGFKGSAETAARLMQQLTGSVKNFKTMKPGEELETSLQGSARLGVNASTSAMTPSGRTKANTPSVGVEGSHTIGKKEGCKIVVKDGQKLEITVTVDDSSDWAGSVSASGGAVRGQVRGGFGSGEGKTAVFMLDMNDPKNPGQDNPDFESLLHQLKSISDAGKLQQFEQAHPELLQTHTNRQTTSANVGATIGVQAGLGVGAATVGGVEVNVDARKTGLHEETTDASGEVIGTNDVGTSDASVSAGVNQDLSAKASGTGQYAGRTKRDKDTGESEAVGNLSDKSTHSSYGKTIDNIITAASNHDLIAALTNPAKLKGETTTTTAIDLDDSDTMLICQEAQNSSAWARHVEGPYLQEWIEVGKKIRAQTEAKDGKIVKANKAAVQKLLAEWNQSLTGSKTHAMSDILRPENETLDSGPAHGKASKWPDGTEAIKKQWDELIGGFNPIEDARKKMKKDPTGALKDLDTYKEKLASLWSDMDGNEWRWGNDAPIHAEMLGHINKRQQDLSKAEQEAERLKHPHHAESGGGKKRHPSEEEQKEAMRDQLKSRRQFDQHLGQMKHYFETTFSSLWPHEQALKGAQGTVDPDALHATLKQVTSDVKLWREEYKEAEALCKDFSPIDLLDEDQEDVDKLRKSMTEVHPHGAEERVHWMEKAFDDWKQKQA
jgi:hypothetical protein